jgi:hypothetical protein
VTLKKLRVGLGLVMKFAAHEILAAATLPPIITLGMGIQRRH